MHLYMKNNEIICQTEAVFHQTISLQKQKHLNQTKEKQNLNILFFSLNILMMNSVPLLNIYQLFIDSSQLGRKAYIVIGELSFCFVTIFITFLRLKITFIDFLKTIFILDSINLSIGVTTVAFVGMMRFLDRNKWEMKVIQIAFGFIIVSMACNVRMLLLYMKWNVKKVIIFKFSLYIVALTYLCMGVYCFYTNYSFTFQMLKQVDKTVKNLVIFYIFAAFEFSCKLVRVMSNFDHTQKMKYVYLVKSISKYGGDNKQCIMNVRKGSIKLDLKDKKQGLNGQQDNIKKKLKLGNKYQIKQNVIKRLDKKQGQLRGENQVDERKEVELIPVELIPVELVPVELIHVELTPVEKRAKKGMRENKKVAN